LFLVCCTSITIVVNSKKIKYSTNDDYLNYFKTYITNFNFNFYKVQNFFIQDYDILYRTYINIRNLKITTKFHGREFVYKRA